MKTLLLLLIFTATLLAQWSTDPTVNTPVTTAADDQENIFCISDEQGGMIVTWDDQRNGGINNRDIYIQKFDKYGNPKWNTHGVPICTAFGSQVDPVGISDGEGGAIIFWTDNRISNTSDIYAQRIDSLGNTFWTADGIIICDASGVQRNLEIINDGNNNAILVWQDDRNGEWDIFIQKISTQGSPQWLPNGIPVCTAADRQIGPVIISDGLGGAMVVWDDERDGDSNLYAQKVSVNGNVLWTNNGVVVCSANDHQYYHQAVSDGNGGAIITWLDYRNDPQYTDVYAQRLDSDGSPQWIENGIPVSTEIWDQYYPKLVSDNSGGAIIIWEDWRSDVVIEYYAQRISSSGDTLWAANGIPVVSLSDDVENHAIIGDGVDGIIITWEYGDYGSEDIFAQKLNGSGILQWGTEGVAISSSINRQAVPFIITDTRGGAIICWEDSRNGGGSDIYAQQVSADGNLGEIITGIRAPVEIPKDFIIYQNYPNPFNPSTKISWQSAVGSWQTLKIYDVLGNEVVTLVNEYRPAGSYEVEFDAKKLATGIYFYKLQTEKFVKTKKMIFLK